MPLTTRTDRRTYREAAYMVVPRRRLGLPVGGGEREDGCRPRDGPEVAREARGARRSAFPWPTASARSARADVYSRITDEIVAAIEKGAGDWRMPWHHDGGSIARPRNVASDKPYRGINILALWVAATRSGYAGGTWGTYRQWAERGCQVRRGETATTVVFWKTDRRPPYGGR